MNTPQPSSNDSASDFIDILSDPVKLKRTLEDLKARSDSAKEMLSSVQEAQRKLDEKEAKLFRLNSSMESLSASIGAQRMQVDQDASKNKKFLDELLDRENQLAEYRKSLDVKAVDLFNKTKAIALREAEVAALEAKRASVERKIDAVNRVWSATG